MSFSISSFPRAAWECSFGASRQETVCGADKLGSHAARGNQNKGAARGNQKQRLLVITLLLCCAVFLSGPAFAAVIKAMPDHEPVRMDETFNLEFSSEESVDDDPDFTPLSKDFEILGQNRNSEFSIIDGKMTRQQKWIVSLAPKRSGSIPIPAIAFGSDRSQPATITVQAEGSAAPSPGGKENEFGVKLEVEAEPKDPYVQAQVLYTVRVWIPENTPLTKESNLNDPQIDNALVERLFDGSGRLYSTNRGGQSYTVLERKYAVFPQNSGLLHIEPLHLNGVVEVEGRSLFGSTRRFRAKSEAIDLKVRSIPEQFTGSHWLPAADLKLEESWPQEPPQAKAGEPVTRTLTLRATGSTVGVLPELGADAKLDPSIKHYPDQPALTEEKLPTVGMTAVRQEKAALIPGKAGEFKLPAVEIPWWNTRTDRLEIAKIPERVLKVEGTGEPAPQAEPPATRLPATEPAPAVSASPAVSKQAVPVWQDPWFWLAVFFGTGWLATGLAWVVRRRALPASAKAGPQPALVKTDTLAHKALRQACAQHDAAAARQALLDWAKTRWPAEQPASLGEVATLGGDGLADEIAKLNRSLYSHGSSRWQGEGLWAAVQALAWDKHSKEDAGGLEPLYR